MSKFKKSKQAKQQDKSKLARVKDLPWALLLQMGVVLGKRWRSLSAKERARLTQLTRESQGRLSNLSDKQRKELKKLVGKLDPKRTSRELVLLTRARRRRCAVSTPARRPSGRARPDCTPRRAASRRGHGAARTPRVICRRSSCSGCASAWTGCGG